MEEVGLRRYLMSKVSIGLVAVNSLSHELFMKTNLVSYSAVCKNYVDIHGHVIKNLNPLSILGSGWV